MYHHCAAKGTKTLRRGIVNAYSGDASLFVTYRVPEKRTNNTGREREGVV